jgi:hypothetical protein
VGEKRVPLKRVLCPERVRRVPRQFSWVDQRLVRDRHIERCDVHAAALYLFLVTVADAEGLSYYAEATLARCLSMDRARLRQARADLIRLGLIAYERPLYQVLALDAPRSHALPDSSNQPRAQLARLRARLDTKRPAP